MRLLVALFIVCVAVISSEAQKTPLAVLNCTPSNFPDCGGWRLRSTNPYWSWRLLEGAGPQGRHAVEFTQNTASNHAQYYLGWTGPALPDPPQGSVRYLRMRFKPIGAIDLRGVSDIWTDKFIILADGDNPTGRVICTLRDNGKSSDNLGIFCSRNIDGYPNATNIVPLSADAWTSLQFEFKSSSTTSSADGSLKIWRNENNFSKPSQQSGQFQLDAIRWGELHIGYYANATLTTGGRLVFQIADVEWDDEFDKTYASGR